MKIKYLTIKITEYIFEQKPPGETSFSINYLNQSRRI